MVKRELKRAIPNIVLQVMAELSKANYTTQGPRELVVSE
jgi:hypothetical protein